MKILLLLQPDLFDAEPQRSLDEVRSWLNDYQEALQAGGARVDQVEKFRRGRTKVTEFQWVHCFSGIEAETWGILRDAGCRVAVTPGLSPKPSAKVRVQGSSLSVALERGPIRIARALSQRKWPPVDETSFARAAERFLVTSETWVSALSRGWSLDPEKIRVMGTDPSAAARTALENFA